MQHLAELSVAEYGVCVRYFVFDLCFVKPARSSVTPFPPGDSLLFCRRALASLSANDPQCACHVVALMLIAAIAGDAVNYTIGRRNRRKPVIRIRRFSAGVIWIKPTSFMKTRR